MKIYFNPKNNNITYKASEHALYKDFLPVKQEIPDDLYIATGKPLDLALRYLENLEFLPEDIKKVKTLGIKLIFKNGKEAVDFVKKNNIPIIYDKVSADDIHAQWVNDRHVIIINDRYKNTKNPAEIYAISAALIHEIAHAKDNDSLSSIQEELECLSMNALAFNVFKTKNPMLFNKKISPIIDDGVALYSKLFLGNDKKVLIGRIREKYGNLGLESPNHKAGIFAKEILEI